MLEVRHLTKIYQGQGGQTRALDDVSLQFGDTGLVFILGKSGCGKSTFLNCVGGLDAPTEGEIIVNGKSSKDFSEADFDSYRNTFVGFIFQEYNVLNEFTVEDNVELALQLQGQKQNKDRVREILREVDLADFADRKPNTLSGGQKQRVAIARALVKDPKIIMADEPTGALDFNTGLQVLETLRNLSKTRLVIVVSHDVDFAQSYGDRIIELSDGKVISDTSRIKVPAAALGSGSNVKQVGENMLSIPCGAHLTEDNFRDIRNFINSHDGDVVIAAGDAEAAEIRQASGITEDDCRESFAGTESTPEAAVLRDRCEKADGKDTKFIRSRLPMGKAIRMGASSMKVKPVRLIMTILLSVIAFTIFGLLSCIMTYNTASVAASSFADSGYSYISLEKNYTYTIRTISLNTGESVYDDVEYDRSTYFGEEDAAALGLNPSDVLYGASFSKFISNALVLSTDYYRLNIYNAIYAPEGSYVRENLLYGTYPQTESEICISSYTAEALMSYRFYTAKEGAYTSSDYTSEDLCELDGMEDLVGKRLSFDNTDTIFTITGIFDPGEIPSEYDVLKDNEQDHDKDLRVALSSFITDGIYASVLVTHDYIAGMERDTTAGSTYQYYNFDYAGHAYEFFPAEGTDYYDKGWHGTEYYFCVYDDTAFETTFFDGEEREALGDYEVVCTNYWLYNMVETQLKKARNSGEITEEEYYEQLYGTQGNVTLFDAAYAMYYGNYYYVDYYEDEAGVTQRRTILHEVDSEERQELEDYLCNYFVEHPLTVDMVQYDYGVSTPTGVTVNVVGFYCGAGSGNYGLYVSDYFYNNCVSIQSRKEMICDYVYPEDAIYSTLFVPVGNTSYNRGIFSRLETMNPDGTYYSSDNTLYENILVVSYVVGILDIVFIVAGIVFAVFSALLLFNFISVSIANKKQEIGILRAVGAKGTDVFKIFFSESAIIAVICIILSIVICFITAWGINRYFHTAVVAGVNLFVFGAAGIFMIIGIAIVVAILGTIVPVRNASKKKPVDSIRSV
ncbi:MAG: ATP-binding cassette domain-containing protein [Clostridia bacterium]|nr:ATP-binding cassette domain-containing protein [Clostridia bacterium]